MIPSPALQQFLAAMEYPATKDDLVREAAREGLAASDLHALDQLDRCSYSARWQILGALRTTERSLVAA